MAEEKLKFECPYCAEEWEEKAPDVDGKKLREPVECLPYTRGFGHIFHKGEWGKLGSDFLPLLLWDKKIGILRIPHSGVDVRFKNGRCQKCEEYFDVYANYTDASIHEMDMHEMWGHLLGKKSDDVDSDSVAAYEGETLTGRVFKRLAGLFESDGAAAFLMALGVYLVFLAPLLWRNAPNLVGRNWSAVATEDWMTLLLRGGGAVCLAVLLGVGYKCTDYIRTETGFYELFKVTKRRGITFWKNFSLSRLVGVQSGKGLPAVSQVTLAAGVLSVLPLLVIWVIWRIGPLTVDLGFELGFWLVLSYYIGTSMWLALNTALYILNGVTRIPMNLSPLDHFRNIQVLEKISAFSTTTILTIFFLVLFLKFGQVYGLATSTVGWLLRWAEWGLLLLFVVLSLRSSRTPLLYAIAYIVVSVALPATPLTDAALARARLFVLGSFLSLLLYFHYARSRFPIEALRAKYKNLELKKCDERIRRVQRYAKLRNLLEIRGRIEREPTKALSRLVTSVILPVAIELAGVLISTLLTKSS